jgi:hypothetical protein
MVLFRCETMIPHETFFNISGLFMQVALFFLGLLLGFLIYKIIFYIFIDNKKDNEVKNNGR